MIYGFGYLAMSLAISTGWSCTCTFKKTEFIEEPLEELKNKLKPLLSSKEDWWNACY